MRGMERGRSSGAQSVWQYKECLYSSLLACVLAVEKHTEEVHQLKENLFPPHTHLYKAVSQLLG